MLNAIAIGVLALAMAGIGSCTVLSIVNGLQSIPSSPKGIEGEGYSFITMIAIIGLALVFALAAIVVVLLRQRKR